MKPINDLNQYAALTYPPLIFCPFFGSRLLYLMEEIIMRNVKLIFLAILVSMGFIKANDKNKGSCIEGTELTDGGPTGHSECGF